MRNKKISLCEKSNEIASNMDNFSGWLREKLLEYDPEHQLKQERIHKKHGYECVSCDRIDWFNKKLLADYHCRLCNTKMIYLGHLDRRLY